MKKDVSKKKHLFLLENRLWKTKVLGKTQDIVFFHNFFHNMWKSVKATNETRGYVVEKEGMDIFNKSRKALKYQCFLKEKFFQKI